MKFDGARLWAVAAVVIVLGGYLAAFRPSEAAIAARYTDLDAARAQLEQTLALERRIPALEHERARLTSELDRLHVRERRAPLIERFLRTVAGAAAHNGVAVQSVAAGIAHTTAPAQPAALTTLEQLPLDVTLRGHYGDVIRAVRELNRGDVAARIAVASLGDTERRSGARPLISAAFHITILRESDDLPTRGPRPL